MAKSELLAAVEEGQPDLFLTYVHKYNKKRKLNELEEAISELSHGQVDQIWTCLHSWVDSQLNLLVTEDEQEQEGNDHLTQEQEGSNLATQEEGGNDRTSQEQESNNLATQEKEGSDRISKEQEGNNLATQGQGNKDVATQEVETADSTDNQERRPRRGKKQEQEKEPQGGRDSRKVASSQNAEGYNEKLLESIADFACIYLNTFKDEETYIPNMLLELAVLLHGMVSVVGGDAQGAVVRLCELWWLRQLDQHEHLISNILPILLLSATNTTALKKDVVRLWVLHKAVDLMNISNPECEVFAEQLVACASATVFLSCDEGIKWLASLFLRRSLLPRLHKGVKSVLPGCTILQSSKYAEVYFRAWKLSPAEIRKVIEEVCIQDLMYAAIHVDPLAGRLSTNLHHFLSHIHRQKRHHAVSTMICALYEPILWRSLKVANGLVRMNTAGLLCDAFPLSDATLSQEERGDLLEKQYQAIITLLTDPCHLVRITAIKGTLKVLSSYWLMMPSHIIKTIFQKLISELIYDASSSEVRTQVVKGMTALLDSRDAVPFLIDILPRVGEVFDDPSVNVRVAFIKLLLKVKASKVMKYWDIVTVEHLLHRLEEDRPVVCQLLTNLLLNSFHPTHRDDQELVQRSLALLEENRAASRRFYRYASRKLELSDTIHFMLLLWRCLRNHVRINQETNAWEEEGEGSSSFPRSERNQTKVAAAAAAAASQAGDSILVPSLPQDKENSGAVPGQQRRLTPTPGKDRVPDEGEDQTEGEEEDESEDSEEGTPLDDPKVVGALLDTVVILWTTNAHKLALPQNLKFLLALRTRVAKAMPSFFKFFKDNSEVSQTLLYLSSFLPRRMVPTLVGHCLSRLKTLQAVQGKDDSYATYINALCNWNRADDVLELASEWLEEGFKQGTVITTKERRKSLRGVRFHEVSAPQPLIALRLIRHIMQHPLNKLSALEKYRHLLLDVTQNMAKVKDLISERMNHTEELSDLCSDTFLCECWAQYLSMVAVLHKPTADEKPQSRQNEAEGDGENEEEEGSDGEHPDDLLFDSAACVCECWNWASSIIVPMLSEDTGGKRKERAGEEGRAVTSDILSSLVTTSSHILMTGAITTQSVYKICGAVDHLLQNDSSGQFWQKSLVLAVESHQYLEVYGGYCLQPEADQLVLPSDIVKTIISTMSDYFQHHENMPKGTELLRNTLAHALLTFGQESKHIQMEIISIVVSTILEHLCNTIDKKQSVDLEVRKVCDLGECVGLLVGVSQGRAKLSTSFMESLAEHICSIVDSTSLLASTYLINVLVLDSGKISRYSLKQAVVALDDVMSRIIISTNTENEEEEPASIYEEYAKSAKTILQDLKSSLGVV